MTGCTPFLVNLMTTPDAKLVKADPARLAEKYLPGHSWGEEWVRLSLQCWMRRSR
jgi:hypothetical protein